MRKGLYVLFSWGLPIPIGLVCPEKQVVFNFNKNNGKPLYHQLSMANTGLGNRKVAMEFQEKAIELKKINLNE